ncbi:hypothetical protein [Chryseolinea soli]|uniref:ATP-binding protein n=1 Tax=Chryseolinea soli TaxID=2321403 RepID=A0A385SNR1_9BACT|nr:hypothetical protein [Chryseolinea soli]AYB31991.1 hypothetical protein D4L85_16090 [Chryseolinea soli]
MPTPIKHTTSINIIRDSSRNLNYIPTPNGISVVNQISNDFKKGIRSFNIIGSYGTGKSSFLWALEQSLLGKQKFFKPNFLPNPKVKFIHFVGEYGSIINHFAGYFDLDLRKLENENILLEIFAKYKNLGKNHPLLVIVIDEFGKYLEYASENFPERELYFVQQLAEFVNNPDNNIILVTTLHQNFEAYALALNRTQKAEWTKVRGRFRELTFNEPVEQLLFLAAEHLKVKTTAKNRENEIKSSLSLLKKSRAFTVNYQYSSEVAYKLYPLDILSAHVLTLCLQRYGQNERSLFSFLESADRTSLSQFDSKRSLFYNIANVYDYFIYNFYSFISSRYNPDFAAWASIKDTLDNVERTFDVNIEYYSKIVKTIGLLNITAVMGAELDATFLIRYSEICLQIPTAEKIIEDLKLRKLIAYRNYNKRFVLLEGTDLDIPSALQEAGNRVDEINDVATLLNRYYQLPPMYAKAYYYKTGTPRLFEYKITEFPFDEPPRDEIDGFINLVFSEKMSLDDVIAKSLEQTEAIIYVFYKNSRVIKNLLFEIEKTKKVIDDNATDRVATKELNQIFLHQKLLLNHYIITNLYAKKSEVTWIYQGKVIKIQSKRVFSKFLSEVCFQIYYSAPVFKNELVNKHKISSSIFQARKSYFTALVDNWNQPDLGFHEDKFPAEKTIYLTLLKQNGIKLYSDESEHVVQLSRKSSFIHVWKYSIDFLNSAKKTRRSINEFIEPLTRKPFKLKQGLIDLWIASFLFVKRDDFALFNESGFIPNLTEEVLDLLVKKPSDFELKTFDIEGVKLDIFNSYRMFLNQDSKEKINTNTFIETIKPFLTFYRNLPEYSRGTKRLKSETIAVREAIAQAKDPEKAFFEDFPNALGYSVEDLQQNKTDLKNYITKLQEAIRELRTAHSNLILRFEEFIQTEIIGEDSPFEVYKKKLQDRYKKLKKHLCLPHQKTFINRVDSPLSDRDAWLNSLTQSILTKNLDVMKDEDEIVFYDKFKNMILELDSLTSLLKDDIDAVNEDVFGIEMNSFNHGLQKKLIRYPKSKKKEIHAIEEIIKKKLGSDQTVNIAALSNILQDLIS